MSDRLADPSGPITLSISSLTLAWKLKRNTLSGWQPCLKESTTIFLSENKNTNFTVFTGNNLCVKVGICGSYSECKYQLSCGSDNTYKYFLNWICLAKMQLLLKCYDIKRVLTTL